MRRAVLSEAEEQLRLQASISGLAERASSVSARRVLSERQRQTLLGMVVVLALGAIVPSLVTLSTVGLIGTLAVASGVIIVAYCVTVSYRLWLILRSVRRDAVVVVSDEEARAVPDDALPVYTLLIPAYREPEVINLLLWHLGRLEYPSDRLDVKILVESDDHETIAAIAEADVGDQFEMVVVPAAEPRTKPKALNYGLGLARGDFVAIYDVEDEPDPLQLRRAAIAFARLGDGVGCLQAKLGYYNAGQNIITRWFTLEYAMTFSLFLPGLASSNAPVPLGGTSNHFRREVLRAIGAWDPYNVTEDADLGIRLAREGFGVKVLESTTYEEANSDFVNWVRQRSRWYKGYLQTFFVHMRNPIELVREIGWRGTLHFTVFVGGTPILAMLNPVFWALTVVWFVAQPHWVQEIFPVPVYYFGLLCLALGNFAMYYLSVVSCRLVRRNDLLVAAALIPVYWVMMSVAAVKALLQLIGTPFLWEKTFHGLHAPATPAPTTPVAVGSGDA